MKKKRLIASTLAVLLSAVQVAAWAVALNHLDQAAARPLAWPALDRVLAVLSEPALLALAGCASIVLGIVVGTIGRRPQPMPEPEPDSAHLHAAAGPTAAH